MYNRKRWFPTVIFLFILCTFTSTGQNVPVPAQKRAQNILAERGEIIIRFRKPGHLSFNELSRYLSIDNFRNDTVFAYADEKGYIWFHELGIPYEIVEPPSLNIKTMTGRADDLLHRYPSYNQYLETMNSFVSSFPDISRLVEFGTSVDGRKLIAIKITDNPGVKEKEPVVFYTASMHGDEPLGYVLMLRLIGFLLSEYFTNEGIKDLVDRTEIWINPLANPDGAYFMSDTSVAGSKRFNKNNVDLNRDFPKIPADFTDSLLRQPETSYMMSFLRKIQPTLAANFHSGSEVVNYPWDSWQTDHPDNFWYRRISRAYADTVHNYAPGGYMSVLNNGITKGIDWYKIEGGRQDYVNYYLYGREVTIELSNSKIPPEGEIEKYWDYNRQSLVQYISNALTGFCGTVTDSATGMPLKARIRIVNHDKDNSFVFSRPDNGNYFRLLREGTYRVVFSAGGYVNKVANVSVNQGELTNFDVKLSSEFELKPYPNPFREKFSLNIAYSGYWLEITFIDLTGRKVKIIRHPVTNAGEQEISVDDLLPGYYIIQISYNNQRWQVKGIKSGK